jgi:hypothetical protein
MFPKIKFLWAILVTIFLHIPCLFSGEVYRWTDEKGTVYFTDDDSKIPEQDSDQAERVEVREEILKEVEKMEKFAKDRVKDALIHAGFIFPPSEAARTTWGDAYFDAIGVSSKYLILGEVKWGDEVTESEVESLIGRAFEAEKRGRGRELVLFIASLRNLGGRAREMVEQCQKKSFVVSFEEVRPYPL